jgi:ankyrin repeat protein
MSIEIRSDEALAALIDLQAPVYNEELANNRRDKLITKKHTVQ